MGRPESRGQGRRGSWPVRPRWSAGA